MATPTLAKSPAPNDSQPYDGKLIDELTELVERVEEKKPAQSVPTIPDSIPTDEERKARTGALLWELWQIGESMNLQAFEIPARKRLDPLTVALNGFPDVNTSRDHYDCARTECE